MIMSSIIDALREGSQFEAKAAQNGLPRSLWETYSAFANTNGGTIVLGVEEKEGGELKVVGIRNPESLIKSFWDTVNNPSKTSANVLVDSDVRVDTYQGKQIIFIEVPRASRMTRPVYINGNPVAGTFRRNGEGDYHCAEEEYLAMVRDSSSEALDSVLVESVEMDGLCMESVRSYRNALSASRPNHPWSKLTIDEMLLRLGAIGRRMGESEFHPTRAGLLMFGYEYEIVREFPHYFLDYRSSSYDRRWDDRVVSNDGEWSGNIFDFWLRVAPRLAANITKPFELGEDLKRIEDDPMRKAVREALANTLVHADYYGRRYTVIVRHEDRIEFANPGGLRLPAEVVLNGGFSDARNPTLMKMFGLLDVCEKAGSGFDAIRYACAQARASSPLLVESFNPDRTELVLFLGESSALSSVRHGRERGRAIHFENTSLTDREKAIALIDQKGETKSSDIAHALGFSTSKAKRILAALVEGGDIEVYGSGRATRYRPAK